MQGSPTELADFVLRPDPSTTWRVVGRSDRRLDISLQSQIWQGQPWTHQIVMVWPEKVDHSASSILYITGGDPNPLDLAEAEILAEEAGMPVAHLFGIPNQPIWDLMEDDLIAHSFVQYIETEEPSWPLLLPMAKAAVRALDAVQEATGIGRFLVTGGSKRGWTTWLAAATGDLRIVGIAPMVFDNLNFPAQMAHQVELWGAYSPMIEEYTERDLQEKAASPVGERLSRMVDPFTYLPGMDIPILIVNGANDGYWTVDALSLYWDELPEQKAALIVPNAGHLLGDKAEALTTIAAFARACAGEFQFPYPGPLLSIDGDHLGIRAPGACSVSIWTAKSPDLIFTTAEWIEHPGAAMQLEAPSKAAAFGQALYCFGNGAFRLSTPVHIWR